MNPKILPNSTSRYMTPMNMSSTKYSFLASLPAWKIRSLLFSLFQNVDLQFFKIIFFRMISYFYFQHCNFSGSTDKLILLLKVILKKYIFMLTFPDFSLYFYIFLYFSKVLFFDMFIFYLDWTFMQLSIK